MSLNVVKACLATVVLVFVLVQISLKDELYFPSHVTKGYQIVNRSKVLKLYVKRMARPISRATNQNSSLQNQKPVNLGTNLHENQSNGGQEKETVVPWSIRRLKTQSRLNNNRERAEKACNDVSKTISDNKSNFQMRKMSQRARNRYGNYVTQRLEWCTIPKSGTTFLKRHLYPTLTLQDLHLPTKHSQHPVKRFILVREPYSRLVSGYFSKIVGHPQWWKVISVKIIGAVRKSPSAESLRCGHDVTFPEFIQFLIESYENKTFKNDHFIPMSDVCNVCDHMPDYIAKLENVKDDMKFILESVNVTGNTSKPFLEVGHLAKLFMSFKENFTECVTPCWFLNRYWWGQQGTGLISKKLFLPLQTERQCAEITSEEFASIAEIAYRKSVGKIDKNREKLEMYKYLWSRVPLSHRLRVRKMLQHDCAVFGYESTPSYIFPELMKGNKN